MVADFLTYMAMAAAVWGPAPCGEVQREWAPLGTDYAALADSGRCAIVINTRLRRYAKYRRYDRYFCTLVVHEWGHLTGHGHSDDLYNVMAPEPWNPYWRCLPHKDRADPSWWEPAIVTYV